MRQTCEQLKSEEVSCRELNVHLVQALTRRQLSTGLEVVSQGRSRMKEKRASSLIISQVGSQRLSHLLCSLACSNANSIETNKGA